MSFAFQEKKISWKCQKDKLFCLLVGKLIAYKTKEKFNYFFKKHHYFKEKNVST